MNNNPENLIDPDGELASIIGGIIGDGIAGGIAGGTVGALSSFACGDSPSGIISNFLIGFGIGAAVGGFTGGLAGAGIIGPWGLAATDFWAGFNVALNVGEVAALESKLGATAAALASIFTDPTPAYGPNGSRCRPCR